MWRRTALIVVIGLSLTARSKLNGQEKKGRKQPCPDLLFSDLGWVRFDVVMGQLVAATNRTKQDRQRAERTLPCGGTETLVVSIDRGLTSLQYQLESDAQKLSLQVIRRENVCIRWESLPPGGVRTTMLYQQTPGKGVGLTIRVGTEAERTYQAASLWHLLVAEPELRESHICDILESLRPDWHLREEVNTIRTALVNTAPWSVPTSMAEVEVLVRQMKHGDFCVRQAADRELRSRGRAVLCLLDRLDPQRLDCEQRLRIHEIRRHLTGSGIDTPQRVTAWLINNKQVWTALDNHDLDKHDAATGHVAARAHLTRIIK